MNILFDHERLRQLITSLNALTGIPIGVFDADAREICETDELPLFCQRIKACPQGQERCGACGTQAVARHTGQSGAHCFRCHAGICQGIIPIRDGERILAYVFFGQILDDADPGQQWEHTAGTLDWYPGDREALRQAFYGLRRYSRAQMEAFAQVLGALASYIRLDGIIQSSEQTDLQKLERYLDEHYTEKLSLESIAADLRIGRTKLCALAKKLSGGATISQMLTQRRIRAAKKLLAQGDMPISAVAEAVGVSDYNYFTKIFRTATGMTPSAYRRESRHNGMGQHGM